MLRTRFAPSPTGLLHLGNVYSVLQCEAWVKRSGAEFLLRIEDIDFTRCKPEFTQQIIDDLAWLGINFTGELIFQHQRLNLYQEALDQLIALGVLYPCFCTRKEIRENTVGNRALDSYAKTCLSLSCAEVEILKQVKPFSWRLNSDVVQAMLGKRQYWIDFDQKEVLFQVSDVGDVIIARKDIQYSYHLAVVVDDAAQYMTHIIRGKDLRSSTPIHCILQKLLGYELPLYSHHRLLMEEAGSKLSKRKQSMTLKSLRNQRITVEDVRKRVGM
ncbi:MAG: tRNA glutamyl-Q(34) synthetase GluQRS [Ghiorsea sp.]|nr:tRNA glutamyl-Q(34) synthetase GluQRS [Ghiorsea sp.]